MATTADARGAVRTGRAAPLPPDERRRAILTAVQPVLLARGAAVTTRELAQAADVSEGTLFRVFPDKSTLLRQVVLAALDPASVVPELDAIDLAIPLADRLTRVLELGFERVEATMRWFGILHKLGRLDDHDASESEREDGRLAWARAQRSGQAEVRGAVLRVLEPDAAAFGRPLGQVAALLDVVLVGSSMQQTFAARRGETHDVPPVEVLVTHFLHGVLAPVPTRSQP